MAELKIGAKDLGYLSMPDFCPRCFWFKRNAPDGIPFQIFPGIFNSIDSYTKKITAYAFEKTGRLPDFLEEIGSVKKILKAPWYTKFKHEDPVSGMVVNGIVDDMFEMHDGSHVIVDYKTAKYTEAQDKLLPIYDSQLNAYALIDTETYGAKISGLHLVYCEPITDGYGTEAYVDGGFNMKFHGKVLRRPVDTGSIPALMRQAKDIMMLNSAPDGRDGCKDCKKLDGLLGLMNGGK